MSNFRAIDRKTGYLLPPSVDEWLPEKHLARFIVDVIDGLDLGRMSRAYRGTGSASYHPRTLSILVYGYATGVFSSHKLERATWDFVAFRYIAGGEHPDHDTIATFRRRFLKDIEKLFVDVLRLARDAIVLVSGGRWAHDLKGVAHDPIEGDRVAYAWHCYPGEGMGVGDLAFQPRWPQLPEAGGGYRLGILSRLRARSPGRPGELGIPFARDVLDRLGLHSTAWCWSPGAMPAMLDPDWRTATVFGSFVRSYLSSAALSARSDSRDC